MKNTHLYRIVRSIYRLFKYVFYPYGYIRNYIIFPIIAFLRTHHVGTFYKKYSYIEGLKNIHMGERCFIIATGPSLQISDVNQLEGEVTIAVNSFYKVYEETCFRPTYYMVLDPEVQSRVCKYSKIPMKDLAVKAVFLNSMKKINDDNVKYLPLCYQDHWFNIFNTKYNFEKNLKYTEDMLWGIYDKYTITIAAIDLAIYMGCKEIYLLGVDCNYSGPKQYFNESDKDGLKKDELQAMMTQKAMMTGYHFVEKETKKRNIKIYNATRGGMLEEFERINFDEIMKKARLENYDNA